MEKILRPQELSANKRKLQGTSVTFDTKCMVVHVSCASCFYSLSSRQLNASSNSVPHSPSGTQAETIPRNGDLRRAACVHGIIPFSPSYHKKPWLHDFPRWKTIKARTHTQKQTNHHLPSFLRSMMDRVRFLLICPMSPVLKKRMPSIVTQSSWQLCANNTPKQWYEVCLHLSHHHTSFVD